MSEVILIMSMQDKTLFLRQLETALSTTLTASDMSRTLTAVADTLEHFDIAKLADSDGEQDDLLQAYLAAMEIQGRSKNTMNRYVYIIKRMMAAVKVTTRHITVYHLRKYLMDEKARGVGDRTLEGYRQIFSSYFNWLQRESLIVQNPTANLGAIKCQKKLKQAYSDIDIEKLMLECDNLRDRAIIRFLMSTGCRISEMVQLNRDDIDFASLECTVLGKGNKERTVYLDSVAGMTIRQYLEGRRDNEPALFIGKGTERLHPGGVRLMLNNLSAKAGVENVHPHKFRRTLATNLIKHGMPIQEVAAILGHDKLDTTMQYVVLDKTQVRSSYSKFA